MIKIIYLRLLNLDKKMQIFKSEIEENVLKDYSCSLFHLFPHTLFLNKRFKLNIIKKKDEKNAL